MNLIDYIFPPKCVGCDRMLEPAPKRIRDKGNDALCKDCRAAFEQAKLMKCKICGRAFIDCRCVPRVLKGVGCKTLIKLCAYNSDPESVENRLLFCFKKWSNRKCEMLLASQMANVLLNFISEYPDFQFCLTNVPRIDKNIIEYGYDHAERLCKLLASKCGIPYIPMLERRNGGKEQKSLNDKQRRENVKGAFMLSEKASAAKGKVVILIDDVVTTGVSLAEAFNLLHSNGFDHIMTGCAMVTTKKRKNSDFSYQDK